MSGMSESTKAGGQMRISRRLERVKPSATLREGLDRLQRALGTIAAAA